MRYKPAESQNMLRVSKGMDPRNPTDVGLMILFKIILQHTCSQIELDQTTLQNKKANPNT